MTTTPSYVATVVPTGWGWTVLCTCGYRVPNVPTQGAAQAFLDNHVAGCHASDDDDT